MKRYIYADNAATTKLDIDAFEAMKPYLLEEYGNASQPYSFARNPKKALIEAKGIIAKCINASPDEIFITSGGTESDNWAIKGGLQYNSDRRVTITSCIEHHAILNACKKIEQLGYPVIYLPVTNEGIVSVDALKAMITSETHLVSIMFANNEIGTIEPIKELASIAHDNGVLFHTDAVQALGHVKIDVKDLGVDMLSASAHKFNGPKGIGFLYIRQGVLLQPLIDGGSQEHGRRAGTENIPSIVAMAVALQNNCLALEENQYRIRRLEERLIAKLQLQGIDFVRNGSSSRIPGNISLSFKGADGETILHRMDLLGIEISTGSACDSVNSQVSHVIRAIGLDDDYAKGTIRISISKDNSESDVDTIVSALARILKEKSW